MLGAWRGLKRATWVSILAGPTLSCGGEAIVAAGAGDDACESPAIVRICVRGEVGPDGIERVDADIAPRFELYADGCFSSSCTRVVEARCELVDPFSMGARIEVDGSFCVQTSNDGACTDDCGGVPPAVCRSPALPPSPWFLVYQDLEIAFEVPSELPSGGLCVARGE